ncbi:hypothetical protein GH714_009130 [Hevea brasiliensis]|uniref:NB-ARC domain-containing protein n=1 Tax=Hevea brasiliensis TaxID=3981 RepID=A0A6A6KC58_HEVBR|nr:hypothetical protein GH714_009130 [Hevea brasiliensis]
MSSLPNNNAAFKIPTSSGRQYNVAVAENQVTDVEMTLRELVQIPEQEIGEGTTIALPGVGSEMENNAGGLVPPVNTLGDTLLTREVGENFEEDIEYIWSCLMNDILRIGIYGMGGVGKTELAKHLNNKLLQDPNKFHHVYWVNVSPNCSIHKLQNSIAKAVGINLSSEDDENKRAARLSKELTQNKRSILIFDDVWDYISLEDVGIPIGMNGCTLILTTRSFEVCRQTNCQKTLKMETLSEEEGWCLFEKEVGDKMTLSNDVEKIAKSVVSELEGLPLGIRTMARYMRGVVNIQQWRNARKGWIQRQVSEEIFRKLKLSYDYLKDPALQQCFLYCAFFPLAKEDELDGWIEKDYLIQYLIDEGIIKRMNSRREEFDEGHTMLNILENVCLLNSDDYAPPMHDLIRSMALQIMKESSGVRAMIESGKGLKELPEEGIWTGDLVRVSLHNNSIKEIASNHSPRCPNLSTLLLHDNLELRRIADSFFEHLHGLNVLDLSNTGIQNLPNSVTTLVNLASLVVSGCAELRRVPSLANLRELKRLDLGFSGVEEVPDGLEFLSKLMYLDLCGTSVKERRRRILPKSSHLQFLKLPLTLAVEGEEVASLSKVETLHCPFP